MQVKSGRGARARVQTPSVSHPDSDRVLTLARHQPWRLLTEPDARQVDLPESSAARQLLLQEIRDLPAGTTLVLCCSAIGSRWRARRFAREAGINVVREYAAIPSAGTPTCLVEDTPQAMRYFLSRVLALPRGGPAVSAMVGAAKAVARFDWPCAVAGAGAPKRIVLARTAADSGDPGEPPRARSLLDVRGMQSVVLALSKDPNAKLTVLLIPHGRSEPTLAVKVPTTEAADASIEAERRVLTDLRARLPGPILSTIPALSHLPEAGGRPALVTTALPGSPMSTRYHAWRHLANRAAVEADFSAVERWLAQFQSATSGTGVRCPIEMDGASVEILARRFADDRHLEQTLSRLDAVQSRLRNTGTPRTAVHGDFWMGNLLLVGDEISGVVDWEAGSVSGEPVRDLVRFALTFALYLDRHSRPGHRVAGHHNLRAGVWGAGIEFAIDGQGWFPDLVRKFLQDGLRRLGANPGCWRDTALAGLAEIAATADHLDFAGLHWQLFDRLSKNDSTAARQSATA